MKRNIILSVFIGFNLAFIANASFIVDEKPLIVQIDQKNSEELLIDMKYMKNKDIFMATCDSTMKEDKSYCQKETEIIVAANAFILKSNKNRLHMAIADTLCVSPIEMLPAISYHLSENFLKEHLKNQKDAYKQFANMSVGFVKNVYNSTSKYERDIRSAFAIITLLKAYDEDNIQFKEKLLNSISINNEIKSYVLSFNALDPKSEKECYAKIFEYFNSKNETTSQAVLHFTGPQILDSIHVDMTSSLNDKNDVSTTPFVDQAFGGFDELNIYMQDYSSSTYDTEVPKSNADVPWNPKYNRDNIENDKNLEPMLYPFCIF